MPGRNPTPLVGETPFNVENFSQFFTQYSNPLSQTAKRNLIPFRTEKKGESNHFKYCNKSVCICLLHETILYLSGSEEKIWKCIKKVNLSGLQLWFNLSDSMYAISSMDLRLGYFIKIARVPLHPHNLLGSQPRRAGQDCVYFYEPERPFMHLTDCCWFLISSGLGGG